MAGFSHFQWIPKSLNFVAFLICIPSCCEAMVSGMFLVASHIIKLAVDILLLSIRLKLDLLAKSSSCLSLPKWSCHRYQTPKGYYISWYIHSWFCYLPGTTKKEKRKKKEMVRIIHSHNWCIWLSLQVAHAYSSSADLLSPMTLHKHHFVLSFTDWWVMVASLINCKHKIKRSWNNSKNPLSASLTDDQCYHLPRRLKFHIPLTECQ